MTWVYRLYSETELLYVGIAEDPERRVASHKMAAIWGRDIAKVVLRKCRDRKSALDCEARTICDERPRFNKTYVNDRDDTSPVARAIQKAGGRRQLAEAVGVTRQAVEKWLETGTVPANSVPHVVNATGVPAWDLNPEVFGFLRERA